jgi:hypothetical protein
MPKLEDLRVFCKCAKNGVYQEKGQELNQQAFLLRGFRF